MSNIIDDIKHFRKKAKMNLPIDPNQISGVSVLLSFLSAYLIFKNMFIFSALVLFIILFLDFLDGVVARGRKIDSYQGQIVDWAADRMSEIIIFAPLFLQNTFIILIPSLNILVNFLVVKGKIWLIPLRHMLLIWLIYMVLI
jgi:phosphatidylglycerophosphate synthase